MSCTWPIMCFLSITSYCLCAYAMCSYNSFVSVYLANVFVHVTYFELDNLAQLIPFVYVCKCFFYIFFYIVRQAFSQHRKENCHLKWQRIHQNETIMKIWLQIVLGFSTIDTVQTLEYTGLCSLGAIFILPLQIFDVLVFLPLFFNTLKTPQWSKH